MVDARVPWSCAAIGIPLVLLLLLLLAALVMEQWLDQLPPWLQRFAERPSWLWNTGIGLIIGLIAGALATAALRLRELADLRRSHSHCCRAQPGSR